MPSLGGLYNHASMLLVPFCCLRPCACPAQERKGEKRATLNQLLDDFHRAAKKAGSSSCSLSGREEQEWLVQEMILQGLLTFEFGFTAYNTNTYLVATPNSTRLGRQRCVHVKRQVQCLQCNCSWCRARSMSCCTPTSITMPLARCFAELLYSRIHNHAIGQVFCGGDDADTPYCPCYCAALISQASVCAASLAAGRKCTTDPKTPQEQQQPAGLSSSKEEVRGCSGTVYW